MSLNCWGLPRVTQWMTLETVRRQLWKAQTLFKRFDIILDAIYETWDTEIDSCFSMFPWRETKRVPEFSPGDIVSGHIVLHPTAPITITGLELLFGGKYTVRWQDAERTWGGYEPIFTEKAVLIQDSHIDLQTKAYWFDFHYTLPNYIPSPLKRTEGSSSFYVYGKVYTEHRVSCVQTTDIVYDIRSHLDIGRVPCVLHTPAEMRKLVEFPLREPLPQDRRRDIGVGVVCVKISLNRRAFVLGEHIIVDVSIWNLLNGPLQCKVAIRKVIYFYADHAIATVQLTNTHVDTPDYSRTKTKDVPANLGAPTKLKVAADSTETFSRTFDIPFMDAPTTLRKFPENLQEIVPRKVMPVRVQHMLQLLINPTWTREHKIITIPLVIGTEDSRHRLEELQPNQAEMLYVDFLGSDFYQGVQGVAQDPPPYIRETPPRYDDCVR